MLHYHAKAMLLSVEGKTTLSSTEEFFDLGSLSIGNIYHLLENDQVNRGITLQIGCYSRD